MPFKHRRVGRCKCTFDLKREPRPRGRSGGSGQGRAGSVDYPVPVVVVERKIDRRAEPAIGPPEQSLFPFVTPRELPDRGAATRSDAGPKMARN